MIQEYRELEYLVQFDIIYAMEVESGREIAMIEVDSFLSFD